MKNIKFILVVFISLTSMSCKKFLDIDPPKTSVSTDVVFQNNDLATSAVLNLYTSLNTFSIGFSSITFTAGFSSDELINYADARTEEFYENEISPSNSSLESLFGNQYTVIFKANSILEGLANSKGLSSSIKNQLQGETLFIRAFAYFYLVNLYGEVPLQLQSDYRINRTASRAEIFKVYQQILRDLHEAEGLLTDQYISGERVRANLSTVQAFLARIYLYNKDWANAEKYSSLIIAKNATYNLVTLDEIFLKNSKEAIWQLFPPINSNGGDGQIFILTATPTQVSLRSSFALSAFEPNDKRKTSWIKTYTNISGNYYYPFKYKVKSATIATEYSTVLRLAEQYLIRAEARVNQDKLEQGLLDLNTVRLRPINGINTNPITPIPNTLNKDGALLAIEAERRIELFAEWGHRWFDLKRFGKATIALGPLKSKWQATDVLYPIPYSELTRNPNIYQNDGY